MRPDIEGLFIAVMGIVEENDALFSIGLGANAVGFDFGPTTHNISTQAAHDIIRRLPHGALSIGVFRNETPQRIVEIANSIGLSIVQVQSHQSRSDFEWIQERVATVFSVAQNWETRNIDALITPNSDSKDELGQSLNAFTQSGTTVANVCGGGLDCSNVVEFVQRFPVWGIEVLSGVEFSPGVKDPALLGQFISKARWAYDNALIGPNEVDNR